MTKARAGCRRVDGFIMAMRQSGAFRNYNLRRGKLGLRALGKCVFCPAGVVWVRVFCGRYESPVMAGEAFCFFVVGWVSV